MELTRRSDEPISQANALADLAEVLDAAGRTDEANQTRAQAIDLYERKGDIVAAAAAREAGREELSTSSGRRRGRAP